MAAVLASTAVGVYFAERSLVMFQVGTPGTIWKGPIPMVLGMFGTFVYGIPFALLLVRGTAPLFGATPGQSIAGLAIAPTEDGRRNDAAAGGAPPTRRVLRFLLENVEWLGLVLGLVSGRWEPAAAGIGCGLARLLSRLGRWRLVDGWTGTRVVRTTAEPAS